MSKAASSPVVEKKKEEEEEALSSFLDDEETEEEKGLLAANKVKFICFGFKVTEKYYMLGLFTLINLFLFADQNLLAPNLSVLADEFNMSADERDEYLGGYISIGFFAIGGIVALVVGYFTDTFNRKAVFAIVVVVGEFSCACTYFVPTGNISDFWKGLWLTRSITGFAVGGALPIQFSILGDTFSVEDRGKAVAFFSIATFLGLSFGQYLAGFMSPDFRTPFLIVSLPTFLLVALFLVTTTEPQRGQAEELIQGREGALDEDHKISWEKLKKLFQTPSAVIAIAQGLFGTLPWGVMGVFLNDFLVEEKEKGSKEVANVLLVFGILTSCSTIFGGYLADKFINTRPRLLPIIAGTTTMATTPFVLFVLRQDPLPIGSYVAIFIIPGALAGMAGSLIKTMLLHVTLPETRGTAFALQSLTDEIGKGFGPYMISATIRAAGTREDGLFLAVCGWFPAGFVMLLITFFITSDKAKNKLALAEAYGLNLTKAELEEEGLSEYASKVQYEGKPKEVTV